MPCTLTNWHLVLQGLPSQMALLYFLFTFEKRCWLLATKELTSVYANTCLLGFVMLSEASETYIRRQY